MHADARFTDGRVPDSTIRSLFTDEYRWQKWLDVEAALALSEAKHGIIPRKAAKAISVAAHIRQLDVKRIRKGIEKTSHPLMALVTELSNATGKEYGGYVHWGATTQNITQTGDALLLHDVHGVVLKLLGKIFADMEVLALKGQSMVSAGRTHGQHAVPITFGFKVAGWIEEYSNHVTRLHEVEPRVFTAMMGGAVGNYASLGIKGPVVQKTMAQILQLNPMSVPIRSIADFRAEYVCILGLLAGTTGKIAKEIYLLMQPEFDEVSEPVPPGTIGSSTMPHKRNPQLADDCIAISAQIRSLVPFALESMLSDHEANGGYYDMADDAIKRACILTGDLLTRMHIILSGLTFNEKRMKKNIDITGGLIMSEAIMLELGKVLGRQDAHEIIYEIVQKGVGSGQTFQEMLSSNAHVVSHLNERSRLKLLNPLTHIGLSRQIARKAAKKAHKLAIQLKRI